MPEPIQSPDVKSIVVTPELIKSLGLLDASMIVAGSMIGSGIFIVSAGIARQVEQPCAAADCLVGQRFDDHDGGALLRRTGRSDASRRRRICFLARISGPDVGIFIRMGHAAGNSDGHDRGGGRRLRELHWRSVVLVLVVRVDLEDRDIRPVQNLVRRAGAIQRRAEHAELCWPSARSFFLPG